jgi:hypothetical protein
VHLPIGVSRERSGDWLKLNAKQFGRLRACGRRRGRAPSARKNAVRPSWPGRRPQAPLLGPISFSVKGSPATHCVNPLILRSLGNCGKLLRGAGLGFMRILRAICAYNSIRERA